jgi:hypothetical protein
MASFTDRATIDGPARITRDGYLVADALVAQGDNVQDYFPAEIGQPPKADGTPYRIGRESSEVFADAAMASAAHRPITVDHPTQDVTAANWRDLGVGDIGGEITQQGKFLRVPVKMMDAAAITKAQTTHREFSLGYSADLDMTPGKIGDADVDGFMRNIRINHLAIVPAARGGPELRIIDERPAHLRDHQEPKTMKITIGDAKDVDLSDGAAVALAVGALNTTLADALARATTAEGAVATHVTTISAKDAEITTLTQAVKDATLTPQQKIAAGKAFGKLVADAQRLAPTAGITDAMDEAVIRKIAVSAKLGDAAVKDWTDAMFDTSFATSMIILGDAGTTRTDIMRDAIMGHPMTITDGATKAATARNAWLADKESAHRATAAN